MTDNTNTRVISWNNGESARAISQALSNGKLLKRDATSPIPHCNYIINFGCRSINRQHSAYVFNTPDLVSRASDKLQFFNLCRSKVPLFFTDKELAIFEAINRGTGLVIRHTVNGHGGEGIEVIEAADMQTATDIPDAPLYTLLIPKRREYRVHVGRAPWGFTILDITRKIHREGLPIAERGHVWNHSNNYIFTRESVLRDWEDTLMSRICERVRHCLSKTGLDFAAFDVVVEKGGPLSAANIYVLEANTAPGMEGFTLQRYTEFFNHRINGGSYTPFPDALTSYMNHSETTEEQITNEE